jgi:glycosyltransferase involved in cell wall biosynthesis
MNLKKQYPAHKGNENLRNRNTWCMWGLLAILMPIVVLARQQEKRIVVITASYNNRQWYQQNLDSVFKQFYDNWHLIYICDGVDEGAQSDGTGELVEQYIKARGMQHKVTLIRNTKRRGALANQYHAIHGCNNTDIIAILDGDDFLATPYVFQRINKEYTRKKIWLTYGQLKEWPQGGTGCKQLPRKMIKRSLFRGQINWPYFPSHLRTFYAALFKRINKEDLMYNGDFMMMSSDVAIMVPMLEMAQERISFIPDILVLYNMANALNDSKVSQQLQEQLTAYVRTLPKYRRLPHLFYFGW